MPGVSVLILNYNGARFIAPCLDSVLAQEYPLAEVLVIDNDSTDGSVEITRADYPQVQLIETGANLGFAGGMNVGIGRSQGEYLLLLNTDVVLDPGFVGALVDAMAAGPEVGSAAGKVYKLAEDKSGILDTTGHIIFRNRLFTDRGDGEIDTGQYDEVEEIFGVCAGTGFYSRAMLDDIKVAGEYFDESFFLFLEDTDLNWRAQLRGWKCLYTPKAVAWHWRGGMAARKTLLVETHNYKNRYMMLLKNDSLLAIAGSAHHFLLTDTLKSVALLWRCPRALAGWWQVWRNLPALLRKRRIIQGGRRVSQRDFERWLNPFDYRGWMGRHLKGS